MLKQRKNKRFNYKPRFSKNDDANANLEDDSNTKEFISKWQRFSKVNIKRGTRGISMRLLIIILVLIIMYILDF